MMQNYYVPLSHITDEYMIIPPLAPLQIKFYRFKLCYHRFAPALEIDQTVSSNSYYLMLNSFMLFKTF
jgi:hypothetical protein